MVLSRRWWTVDARRRRARRAHRRVRQPRAADRRAPPARRASRAGREPRWWSSRCTLDGDGPAVGGRVAERRAGAARRRGAGSCARSPAASPLRRRGPPTSPSCARLADDGVPPRPTGRSTRARDAVPRSSTRRSSTTRRSPTCRRRWRRCSTPAVACARTSPTSPPACLRSLGLAARYVSGYIETDPPPGGERLVGADASHAWCSVWVPDSGLARLRPDERSPARAPPHHAGVGPRLRRRGAGARRGDRPARRTRSSRSPSSVERT